MSEDAGTSDKSGRKLLGDVRRGRDFGQERQEIVWQMSEEAGTSDKRGRKLLGDV